MISIWGILAFAGFLGAYWCALFLFLLLRKGNKMDGLTNEDMVLLKSLVDHPKKLHLGLSPVWAIASVFRLLDRGYVIHDDDWYLSLTESGRKLIEES